MWVVTGPMNGPTIDEIDFEKTFVLLPGHTYDIGRADGALRVNSRKVSKAKHCSLIVGEFSEADVTNPDSIPALTFFHAPKPVTDKEKAYIVRHPSGAQSSIRPGGAGGQLHHEDVVYPTKFIGLRVQWIPVCCYAPKGRVGVPAEKLALLGIHTTPTPFPTAQTTHHLTPTYTPTPALAASLVLGRPVVKPEWLAALVDAELASSPRPSPSSPLPSSPPTSSSPPPSAPAFPELSSLPTSPPSFTLPPPTKFRPAFPPGPALSARHRAFRTFDPAPARTALFTGIRFVCLGEKNHEASPELRHLLALGGGAVDTCTLSTGEGKDGGGGGEWAARWEKALSRAKAKEGKRVVGVLDRAAVEAALGREGWDEVREVADEYTTALVSPADIVNAVLDVDISAFSFSRPGGGAGDEAMDSQRSGSSPLPSFVPNTFPDEPSQVSEPEPLVPPTPTTTSARRRPLKRLASRGPSQEPSSSATPAPAPAAGQAPDEPPAKRPRRQLTRKVNPGGAPIITGLGDSTRDIDAAVAAAAAALSSSSTAAEPAPAASTTATPATPAPTGARRARLKRLAGGPSPAPQSAFGLPAVAESSSDPLGGGGGGGGQSSALSQYASYFAATDPARLPGAREVLGSLAAGESAPASSQTQTQAENGSADDVGGPRMPMAVAHEEESQFGGTQTRTRTQTGLKRKAAADADADVGVENASAPAPLQATRRPPKRRAVAPLGAVPDGESSTLPSQPSDPTSTPAPSQSHPQPQSSPRKGTGAAPGQPDTDTQFLQALPTQRQNARKGRKPLEDEFDRDFNRLRIAKPAAPSAAAAKTTRSSAQQNSSAAAGGGGGDADTAEAENERENRRERERELEEEEDAYRLLADFGDERGLRGNFMVVCEMEVFKESRNKDGANQDGAARPEWEGVNNFKKFKKKNVQRRPPVQLVVFDQNGNEPRPSKTSKTDGRLDDFTQSSKASKNSKTSQKPKNRRRVIDDADEEEVAVPGVNAPRKDTSMDVDWDADLDMDMPPPRVTQPRTQPRAETNRRGKTASRAPSVARSTRSGSVDIDISSRAGSLPRSTRSTSSQQHHEPLFLESQSQDLIPELSERENQDQLGLFDSDEEDRRTVTSTLPSTGPSGRSQNQNGKRKAESLVVVDSEDSEEDDIAMRRRKRRR